MAKFQFLIVNIVNIHWIIPVPYAKLFSVSGNRKDFLIVGIAAMISAKILKIIAMLPVRVTNHKIKPIIDTTPQDTSKAFNFHSDFLLKNEAARIKRQAKTLVNETKACIPTPCFICAKKIIKGASAQHINDTLFGLAFPLITAITYPANPIRPITAPTIAKLELIIVQVYQNQIMWERGDNYLKYFG